MAESVNTLKDETQAIKESAVSETAQIKQLAENAKDEAILAMNEAVGAVASLPDGIVNDSITSPTDTWSSQKIDAALAMIVKPVITSPTNGTVDYTGAITATYKTASTYVGVQNYVKWEAGNVNFSTIYDSYEGSSNLTSWTTSVGLALTTVYVRVKQGSDGHSSSWSDTLRFTTPNIFVQKPMQKQQN